MKKIIALLLCVTILPGFAALAKDGSALLCESFDSYPTNSQEFVFTYRGDPNTRVVEDGRKNKALLLPSGYTGNTVNFDIADVSDIFVMSAKVKYVGGKAPFRITLSDSGNQDFTPLSVNAQGIITLHNGKKVGGVQIDRYTKIDIGINTLIKRYFVIINGRLCASDHLYSNALAKPTKLTLKSFVGEEDSTIYVDNIALYNGEAVRNNLVWAAYNSDTLEFTPIDMKNRKPMVMVNNNFNVKSKAFSGIGAYNKSNIIEYMQYTEDNGCLLMDKKLAATDPFLNIEVSGAEAVTNFVMEVDITSDKLGSTLYLFNTRSDSSGWGQTFRVTPAGDIITYQGTSVGKIAKGEFVQLAAVYKISQQVFDVYVNKEKVLENVPIASKGFGVLTEIRIQQMPNEGNGRIILDNLRIYEGAEPYTLTGESEDVYTVLPDDNVDIANLSGAVAFHEKGRYLFARNRKTDMGANFYNNGKCLMVPSAVFTEGFGLSVDYDENTGEIELGSDIKLTMGSSSATVKGTQITLDTTPEVKEGVIYLPIKALAEKALNKQYLHHETGLVIISSTPYKYADDDSVLKSLSTYLFFPRLSGEEITALYENSAYKNVHPRILATADDFERIKSYYKTDVRMKQWVDNVVKDANKYLAATPQERFFDTGTVQTLTYVHNVLNILTSTSFAWRVTGDERYAERAWKEMEKVSSLPDWNPQHFLDVGEMTYAMSIAYDWCYDYLNDEQRKTVSDAILYNGLEAGREQYQGRALGTNFVFQAMNWNSVCNGGLITGACAIMDVQPVAARYTITNALRSFEYMLPEFAPSGAWVEGVAYWEYTVKFLGYMVDSLKTTLGTDFGLADYTGIDKTADFVFGVTGNCGYNNFHDAGTSSDLSVQLLWLGKHFKSAKIVDAYLSLFDMHGISGGLYDCLWYDPALASQAGEGYPLDITTPVTETGSMRSSWDDQNGMWLAYSGGANMVNHYHLDEGSFVLDMLGERWAVDMGGDSLSYTGGFGGTRNDLFRIRPESHNTLVINPDENPGQELTAYCPIIRAESKDKGAIQVLDMTSAYSSQTNGVLRGFMLTDDRRTAVIRDEIKLAEKSEVYWLMHTEAEVEIISKDTAILTKNGKRMQVKFIAENAAAEFTDTKVEPFPNSPDIKGQVDNSSYSRVGIKLSGEGEIAISVRITPADEYSADLPFVCGKITDWKIPDGVVTPMPQHKGIYLDGKLIDGYKSNENTYIVKSVDKSARVPVVTVDGGQYSVVKVSEASAFGESTVVRLIGEGGKYTTVKVNFIYQELVPLPDIEGRIRHIPLELYASDNPEKHNPDKHVNDDNFETKWAASGVQTLTFEFHEPKMIEAIALNTSRAETRSYKFTIEVSQDGKNYTEIYSGSTKIGNKGYEVIEIPSVTTKYIRYRGHGNNENTWNTINELAILGPVH